MNSYIKHIIEAFDFDSVNAQKKNINAKDLLYNKVKDIVTTIISIGKLDENDKQLIFIRT